MDKFIGLLFVAIFLLIHPGCSYLPIEKKVSNDFIKYPKELEQVHSLILLKKTDDALLKIDDYLNKAENIHWYGHAYFLKGFLFELDEKFDDSIKWYRSAIQHGSNYESRVEAKALYNLSFVYERIGNQDQMLVTLIDLMKRRQYFDVLTGQVEIPARLAAAYVAQGKMKEGMIFHREAANNFQSMVRTQRFKAPREEISKSLYYLGFATFDQNSETYDQLIKKLNIGQKYFLASIEASKSTWSEKSLKRLRSRYDQAWGQINEYQAKNYDYDPLAKKKQTHMRQLVMASDMYDLMHRLQAEEFPLASANNASKDLIDDSNKWISKLEKFAMSLKLGPETIRSKKIKNTKLARYVEEKEEPVKINKENIKKPVGKKSQLDEPKKGDKQQDIGKDPNL